MFQTQTKAMTVAGWVLTVAVVLFLGSGGINALTGSKQVVDGLAHGGYPASFLVPFGSIVLACVLLFAIPRTTVLGAMLLTAYLGGAVSTHVRLGEKTWIAGVVFGIVVWAGVWLRVPALRRLAPWTQASIDLQGERK